MSNQKKSKSQNVIINNVVPLNNGDVALFLSLYKALTDKGFNVKIAAYNFDIATKAYPEIPFFPEICQGLLFRKLPFLKPLFLPLYFILSQNYRRANIIIGAPGGYINSYYSIKSSLSIFKVAKRFGKKTAIYAQSVGPLNESDTIRFRKLMRKHIDFILVRDEFSRKTMVEIGVDQTKYKLTKDAAFLLGYSSQSVPPVKKIAFSVREWKDDNRNISSYKSMISEMVKCAIDEGYLVDFLSTCQGITTYKNDALIASEIYAMLPAEYQSKANILSEYFTFHQFYEKLADYSLVIGTRLHMCITALTKGIPALNISYEIKGKECYEYLDMSEYSIDYNAPTSKALESLKTLIQNQEKIRVHLNNTIPNISKEVQLDFDLFIEKINS